MILMPDIRQRPARTYIVTFNVRQVETLRNILCNSALATSGRASDEPNMSMVSLGVALWRCLVRDTIRHMVSEGDSTVVSILLVGPFCEDFECPLPRESGRLS